MEKAAFWAIFGLATYIWSACQQAAPEQNEGIVKEYRQNDSLPAEPESAVYFTRAERQLAAGEYHVAAVYLHHGIIAFRTDTGRIRGKQAAQINQAIWTLTRLRKRLRNGEKVDEMELHGAVSGALRLHPAYRPAPASIFKQYENDPIFIPVKE